MQSAVVFVALLASAIAAPGGVVQQFPGSTQPLTSTIVRSASHDSAIIKSDQVGGKFAYSVQESPAWGVVSPVVSHVTQPVATTYAVQQQVVQPATSWTVNTAPAHTSTIVAGPSAQVVSAPVVSEVKTHTVPVAATTYGATWPSYASAWGNWNGNTVVDASSPIIYSAKTNLVGVETEKQINQVHHVSQPATAAVTYTAVQQPATATVVTSSSGTPVTWTSSNLHQNQLVSTGTPVAWTTNTVQQPANSIVSTGTQQWAGSVVATPSIAATTYSVPATSSVITTGTAPVATFKTVSGLHGINQWDGVNQWGYGLGQPWAGAWNQHVVV